MIARLLATFALLVTMAVAQPAEAATLTVNSVTCVVTGTYTPDPIHYGTYSCTASVSGGTGSYVSYTWTIENLWSGSSYSFAGGKTITGNCQYNVYRRYGVAVKDSAGATATGSAGWWTCPQP